MEQVVERGTGKSAQIAGYTIAGKTGTAQKLVDRRYSRSDYNASFVGFLPSRKPALDDHRRHRFAARQRLLRRHRRGADLQAHRRGVAAPARDRPDDQPGPARPGRAQRARGHASRSR